MNRRPAIPRALVGLTLLAALGGCSDHDTRLAAGSTTTKPAVTTTIPLARGSAGCGVPPAVHELAADAPGDTPFTLDSGGATRGYRLAVPDSYDDTKPVPLILNLHGSGSNALQASVYSDLPRRAAERGIITVAPDAIGGKWQLTPTGTDDAFITALVEDVIGHYCVDLDRVHVIGMSLGAWKATAVACGHPDLFASVALVAEEVHPPTCPPMAIVAFHGTADHTVPYGEGADPGVTVVGANAGLPGARANIADWAEAGGCSTDQEVTKVGADVELWTYPGCRDGVDVHLYTVVGGDHTWPGSAITIGPASSTTHTIDATDLALAFFEAHPMQTRRTGP